MRLMPVAEVRHRAKSGLESSSKRSRDRRGYQLCEDIMDLFQLGVESAEELAHN